MQDTVMTVPLDAKSGAHLDLVRDTSTNNIAFQLVTNAGNSNLDTQEAQAILLMRLAMKGQ